MCYNLSHDIGSSSSVCARHLIHVSCACVFDLSPIFYFILLIFYFIFHVDRFGGRSPSQVMSPTSSTTTTSQRPLKFSSRSPPATRGPRTCMTRRSVTTPSAERSLHHCSLRSEKNLRAVDKLITLLKKVCCQVSRRLSVMERGDLLWNSLIHSSQTSEKIRATAQKMSQS